MVAGSQRLKKLVFLYFRALFSLAAEGHLKEEDGCGFTELLYLPDLQALLLGLSNGSLLQAHHLLHSISSIKCVFFQNKDAKTLVYKI
jgi:hypothetical protein